MKLMTFLLCFIASVSIAHSAPTRLNLSKAIAQHIVTVSAVTTGESYLGHALKLKVKNTGSLVFTLVMDPGVTFKCDSGGYQPLLLAGQEAVYMPALNEAEISVQTFCGDSRLTAPVKGLSYSYAGVAGDTLVKILDFIKQNWMFNTLGQSAVWVFTNGHNLNTVYEGANDHQSKKLLDFIVSNTGRQLPEYYVKPVINTKAGEEVYQPKTLKIYAFFEEQLEEPKKLTLAIYNTSGEIIQPVFENRQFGRKIHRFKVEFEASGVPAGNYYIRLAEGETVLKETMVEVK